MTQLTHHDVTVILLAVGTLLAVARLFGELATWLKQPAVIGEILAGILLGPTLLGNLSPAVKDFLFPTSGGPFIVLQGLTTLCVVMFLLVAGMHVDLSAIFRQGKAAVSVSVMGIVAPFAVGFGAAWLAPRAMGAHADSEPLIFALFFATALAISALPVIAKTLMDLNLYRTDLGMVVIASAIFDDLAGWIIFAIILALMKLETGHGMGIGFTIGFTIGYVVIMLTIGRWMIHRSLPWLQAKATWPGGVLAFAMSLALVGAAFTEWIGVHAVFGSFLVGVAVGDSTHLREKTKATIEQFVSFVFAPLFFASIGLKLNYAQHFDWQLSLIVLFIATIGKVLGCGIGARWAGMSWRESWAVGFGMNARGAMEIILGHLALQFKLIDERMFVSLVFMAVATSLISGPVMQRVLRREKPHRFADYLSAKGFNLSLLASDRAAAIRELSNSAGTLSGLPASDIEQAVLDREFMMPTGIGNGLAVPHARLAGMARPVVCVGLSRMGVDFHAPDGEKAHLIFLLLTPREDDGAQVQLLGDIARTFRDPSMREAVIRVSTFTEFQALLKTGQATG